VMRNPAFDKGWHFAKEWYNRSSKGVYIANGSIQFFCE
jgi:hypothetical protein